jgi:hypothetical protein
VEELEAVSRLCPHLVELRGVSVGVLDERYRGEKHLQEAAVCSFLHRFKKLERLASSLQLACLNSYLAAAGQHLTSLNCSAFVLFTADILILRRYRILVRCTVPVSNVGCCVRYIIPNRGSIVGQLFIIVVSIHIVLAKLSY